MATAKFYRFVNVFILLILLHAQSIQAQVTIGAGEKPDKDALLDLKENSAGGSTRGLLLPRVSLLSTILANPMTAHIAGMIVYNTAITGDVTPGYYFNDGLKWVRLTESNATATTWLLGGNTNGTIKTIGTNDAYDVPIIVNGSEAMRANWDAVNSIARVTIGTVTPATVALASSVPMRLAKLTTDGGDVSFNGIVLGKGSAQISTNTVLGYRSLFSNTSGTNSLAFGYQSLYSNQTGNYNHAIGYGSLYSNLSGANNLAVGYNAVYTNILGSGNTGIGTEALYASTGGNNVALGFQAAKSLTSGNNNITIGYNQQLASNTGSNQLNIGGVLFGTGLTGSATTPAGNIGVGTASPNSSSILELRATDKGFLPPRVALVSATDVATIVSPATGLLVYNTGTGGLSVAGYYYWDGAAWVRMESVTGSGVVRNITIVTGVRTSANPYVVQPGDYYIFIRLTGTISGFLSIGPTAPFLNTNFNIQLPNPALNPGREIYLINDSFGASGGSLLLSINAYTNYPIFGKSLNTTGNYNLPASILDYTGSYCLSSGYSKIKIVSDGVRWISVNIDVV